MKHFLLATTIFLHMLAANCKVGDVCSDDQLCESNTEKCSDGACSCVENTAIEVDDVCYLLATYNKLSCEVTEQCEHMEDSSVPIIKFWQDKVPQCKGEEGSKMCTCHKDDWYISPEEKCVRGLGADCTPVLSSDCGVQHSECTMNMKCECEAGFSEEDGLCVATGDETTTAAADETTAASATTIAAETSKGQTTKATSTSTPTEAKTTEAPTIKSGNKQNAYKCTVQAVCQHIEDMSNEDVGTATCNTTEEMCSCSSGEWFIYQQAGRPVCTPKLNTECGSNNTCHIDNSLCSEDSSTCICSEGFKEEEGDEACVESSASSTSSALVVSLGMSVVVYIWQHCV